MPRALRCLLRPCLALAWLSLLAGPAHAETPLFSAEGYRTSLYRSPTPNQLDGAQIIDTPALQQLLQQTPRPVLIDVYRRQWLQGRFIEDEPHANLPGSLWLANTGDGELGAPWQAYFARHLQQASAGRNSSFTFRLFFHIERTGLDRISVRCIGNTISTLGNPHRQ